MTAIAFILIFLAIVLVHEWGHFYVARKCGMRVLEFGFGLPPRIASKQGKNTLYSLNALPIGGFVRIAGENGLEDDVPKEEQFESKKWYAKSAVLVAGVVCNVLLGFILFFAAYVSGIPVITPDGTPTIVSITDGFPAQQAGLQINDTVTGIRALDGTPIKLTTEAVHTFLTTHDEPITLEITRSGTAQTITITPKEENGSRMIGVAIESIATSDASFINALNYAGSQSIGTLSLIFVTLKSLLIGLFSHQPSAEGLVGPVGLVKIVGEATKIGIGYVLALAAAISINLAAVNILPFPALDGGRLLIVLLEALTGRTFSKKTAAIIHSAGFIILIGLMIFLTIKDIRG